MTERRQDVVVRRGGSWFLSSVGGDELVEIEIGQVLDMLDSSSSWLVARSGPASRSRVVLPLDSHQVVRPPWVMVGAIGGGTVVVEDVAGGTVLLDRVDLRILDSIGGSSSADLVAAAADLSLELVTARMASLVSAGLLASVPGVIDGGDSLSEVEVEVEIEIEVRDVGAMQVASLAASRPPARQGSTASSWRGAAFGRVERLATSLKSYGKRHLPERRPNGGGDAAPLSDSSASSSAGPGDPAPPSEVAEETSTPDAVSTDRIPVYTIWHEQHGPLLSTGMLTASARSFRDGLLEECYEIRRPETAESFLADLAQREGPAILLSSDYVWCLDLNIQTARAGLSLNPDLVVIHGGPSCPKFEADAERFLEDYGDVAHVLVRGEGEVVLAELLEALSHGLPGIVSESLRGIGGLTFKAPSGETVRTPDQDRIADLNALPSPYLTGEFDDIPAAAWNQVLAIETNRGCPYGCTYCDWGSSTLSRIRKFDIDRVLAELEWATTRSVASISITDANFGIMSRDVTIAEGLADLKRATGFPGTVAFYPAKNTTKHLVQIMDHVVDSGMLMAACLALQTVDDGTLHAIRRDNISTDAFLEFAAAMRRKGLPLQAELIVGLPGQTVESYTRDLQFTSDHEIIARTYMLRVLPNAPLNDPAYLEEFGVVYGADSTVTSTASFTNEDFHRMLAIRRIHIIFEQSGMLRHLLRYLQWDHGLPMTDVLVRILDVVETRPDEYPLMAWMYGHFDLCPSPPVGWSSVFAEVRRFVRLELGVADSDPIDAVLALQEFLLPYPNRTFPSTISLPYDFVRYRRSAIRGLYFEGQAGVPAGRLEDYPPAELTIDGDPLGLCTDGIYIWGESRDPEKLGDFNALTGWCCELQSPLINPMPVVVNRVPAEFLADARSRNAGCSIEELSQTWVSPSESERTSVAVALRNSLSGSTSP